MKTIKKEELTVFLVILITFILAVMSSCTKTNTGTPGNSSTITPTVYTIPTIYNGTYVYSSGYAGGVYYTDPITYPRSTINEYIPFKLTVTTSNNALYVTDMSDSTQTMSVTAREFKVLLTPYYNNGVISGDPWESKCTMIYYSAFGTKTLSLTYTFCGCPYGEQVTTLYTKQ